MGPARHLLAILGALAGAPLLAGAWVARPKLRAGLDERLGFAPRPPTPGSVWLHGASVGEISVALRLADELGAQGRAVALSATTAAGRDLARARRPGVPAFLAPIDHPWSVAAALTRVRPAAVVLIETELWPSWIAGAARRGVPVLVVSGRLSDRAFPRYRRFAPALAPTLSRLVAVGARSELDAERFRELGVPADRVSVTGDLKFDPPEGAAALAAQLDAFLGNVPLFVAGSTHAGEEEAVLLALAAAESEGQEIALALAPRHPERFVAAAEVARRSGRRVHRRSSLPDAKLAAGEVLLLDSVGELAGVYARARLAFVGGSLVPVGGHNVLEPVLAGCPVVFGPHVDKARDAVEILVGSGAGEEARDAVALGDCLARALRDPAAAHGRVEAGRRALAPHADSRRRSVALIETVLDARGKASA